LLDQFSRNLYRDHPRAFAADDQPREILTLALARGFDENMSADQARSVELFRTLGGDKTFGYTPHHRKIIEPFGRFLDRNAALGHESTAEEIRFLSEPNSSF